MRVCIIKASGQLLEAQSGDDGGLDVLIQNAASAGYTANQVQAKVVTTEAFNALLAAAAPAVPGVVTMRQARLALNAAGLLPQVEAAVSAADEVTKINWEYASDVLRDDPLVVTIGAALNLTEEQIDALFIQAATL